MRHLLLVALPAAACAAQLEVLTLVNWQRLPVGETAVMEGGAVLARVSGPSSGYNNPAGLARLERPSVSGTVNAVEYTRVAARTPGGDATADDLGLKPNLVGFANTIDGGGGWSFVLANPITWSSAIEVRSEGDGGSRYDDGRSSLDATVAGLAWGGSAADAVDIGIGIEAWMLDYRYDAGSTAEDGSTVLTSTYTESGRMVDLRLTAGVQLAVGTWNFGALLRSPGMRLNDQGSISASSTSGDGSTTVLNHIRDESLGFDLPLPWMAGLGAAWRPEAIPGLELELDVAISGGCGGTDVLASADGTTRTIDSGGSTTAALQLPARRVNLRTVVNPRAGLRYRLPNPVFERIVRVHLGAYLDRSPVDESNVFSDLDLMGGTAGISAEKGPMLVALGGAYVTSGTLSDAIGYVSSPDTSLTPDLDATDASYAVRTFVLTIASSYRF